MNGTDVAGEVVTAGTALAGLILIYIGSQVTAFGSHTAAEQRTVRLAFLTRAWLGFVGFALALLASALAVIGKWLPNECMGDAAVLVLLAAFAWAIFATVRAIGEIK